MKIKKYGFFAMPGEPACCAKQTAGIGGKRCAHVGVQPPHGQRYGSGNNSPHHR